MDKIFAVKFAFVEGNIETEMHQKNVTPQEAIGLLEMAKREIMDKIKSKQVFSGGVEK